LPRTRDRASDALNPVFGVGCAVSRCMSGSGGQPAPLDEGGPDAGDGRARRGSAQLRVDVVGGESMSCPADGCELLLLADVTAELLRFEVQQALVFRRDPELG